MEPCNDCAEVEEFTVTALVSISPRSETISEKVYGAIRNAIVSRELHPGERLTESGLATRLGVSKTPVREALLQLTYVGLIEADGARGGRVTTPSEEKIEQAYETRAGLEAQVAYVVTGRIQSSELAKIRAIANECTKAARSRDLEGFRAGDRAFHLALAQASGNGYLNRLVHDVYDLVSALRRRDVPDVGDSQKCARQHLGVLAAIGQGSADVAAERMRQHINDVRDMVMVAWHTNQPPDVDTAGGGRPLPRSRSALT